MGFRLQQRIASARALLTKGLSRWLGVAIFFFLAGVVQTWPLVLHAGNSIADWPAVQQDTWLFLWDLWWIKHALVDLATNPFHTDLLMSPQGADLYLHTLATVDGVLSIPLQLLTGNLILTWNVLTLLSFAASGLAMYALSYHVNRNHAAAIVSGYIFAFSPFIMMHLVGGHLNISTTWPIPLFILFVIRFHRSPHVREAIGAGVMWALLTYNQQEYGVDAGLFLGLFVLYWSLARLRQRDCGRLRTLWAGAAVMAAVWLVVSLPLVAPGLQRIGDKEIALGGVDERYSSNLLAFVTPSPLWGPGRNPVGVGGQYPTGGLENTVYLGTTPLLLAFVAVLAFRRAPHSVLFWGIVFLFFTILSLGPHLYVGETKEFSIGGLSFSVPLPYQLYDRLPIISERRAPARMIVFGVAALSILAGTGAELLASWLRRYRGIIGKIMGPLVALLALTFVVVEYWNPPLQLSVISPRPDILAQIREEPGEFAVLDVPLGRATGVTGAGDWVGGGLADYYQTVYEKRTLGGLLSRVRNTDLVWVLEQPGLRYLTAPGLPGAASAQDLDPDLVQSVFREHEIKYVIVHTRTPSKFPLGFSEERLTANDQYLRNVVGLIPVYADDILSVYRNPQIE